MKRSPTLYLNVFDNTIELAIHHSGEAEPQTRRIEFDPPAGPDQWANALLSSAPVLRCAAQEIGVTDQRTPVIVAYRSPTMSCQLVSLTTEKKAAAVKAAKLAALNASPYNQNLAMIETQYLGTDRRGDERKSHVLAVAERIDSADAIAKLVDTCGWSLKSMTTLEIPIITRTVEQALTDRTDDQPTARFYFGQDRSIFIVSHQGRILMFRQIGLGIEHLVTSLCRPIHVQQNQEYCLKPDAARQLLFERGLPGRDTIIDEKHDLHGHHLLPLIQPVLQRLLVELKQSLRFGLTDIEPSELQGELIGPGAAIVGLSNLLSNGMELDFTNEPGAENTTPNTIAGPGTEFGRLIRSNIHKPSAINLVPRRIASEQILKRVQTGLWIGMAAAVAMIAMDYSNLNKQAEQSQQNLETAQQDQTQRMEMDSRRNQVMAVNAAARDLENAITTTVAFRPDWSATLCEITTLKPETVYLVLLEGYTTNIKEDQAGMITLTGYAVGEDAQNQIQEYLTKINDSPLFPSVKLGPINRSDLEGEPAQRFSFEVAVSPVDWRTKKDTLALVLDPIENGGAADEQ